MKFLNHTPSYDLTYNDVFLVPNYSDIASRLDVDLTTPDKVGTTIPIAVANMSAVAGKRMAETVARRGGVTILPQDIPVNVLEAMVKYIKSRDLIFDTPLTLKAEGNVIDALNIIHKRSHGAVVIVNDENEPIGLFSESDALGYDRFTLIGCVINRDVLTVSDHLNPEQIYDFLISNKMSASPVVREGKLVGIITQKGALRSELYKPSLDSQGQLLTAAAIGINGDVELKTEQLLEAGIDIVVLDTAHGHQSKMLEAVKSVRNVSKDVTLVAGNVVTARGTSDLIQAGVNIVKVGVGPGAMCTTRMMTGVGRPQFSAVLECAAEARKMGGYVWADGGIRYPRDVALALAAGASSVMIGSWFASTFESTVDILRDGEGRMYKENYGMASKRAVKNRSNHDASYRQAFRELFEEGISSSKAYINEQHPGVEDIIDQIIAGLRSSMTYVGAKTIDEFHAKAIVGIQSPSGYKEGMALDSSWF